MKPKNKKRLFFIVINLVLVSKNYEKRINIRFYIWVSAFSFFQAAIVSILLYGCTTWTLTKQLEKKLDGNYTRMLWAILNKSWRQHSTKYQLYGHPPPITKAIQVRWTKHAEHCWRSRDKFISDVLLWTPTYGRAKAGRPARKYIQLCEDTGCNPEDLPEAMNDREKWRERVRDICASGTTWWWYLSWNFSSLLSIVHHHYQSMVTVLIPLTLSYHPSLLVITLHHHHDMLLAWISLSLPHHNRLSLLTGLLDYLLCSYCDGKIIKIPGWTAIRKCMGTGAIKYWVYSKREFIFHTCEDGAAWHLIPRKISFS